LYASIDIPHEHSLMVMIHPKVGGMWGGGPRTYKS